MMQPAELQALRDVSARVGRDIELVQGAGGNTSLKLDDVLWVKASGAWLAEAEERDIFVPVDLAGALRALEQGIEKMPVADPAATLRPSIETSLHALMPHRVVLHVHAVNTIAWSACVGAETEMALRLQGLAWARVPYRRPGLPLSQAVAQATAQQKPDVPDPRQSRPAGRRGGLRRTPKPWCTRSSGGSICSRGLRRPATSRRCKPPAAAPISSGIGSCVPSPRHRYAQPRHRDRRLALSRSCGVPGSGHPRRRPWRAHRRRGRRQPGCEPAAAGRAAGRPASARSCVPTSSPARKRCWSAWPWWPSACRPMRVSAICRRRRIWRCSIGTRRNIARR